MAHILPEIISAALTGNYSEGSDKAADTVLAQHIATLQAAHGDLSTKFSFLLEKVESALASGVAPEAPKPEEVSPQVVNVPEA